MRKSNSRNGFSLIELVVVIVVIFLLIALLLPPVTSSREAARRTQCKNNLKQIGLALQNYHDVHLKFPPGHFTYNGASWAATILPFIEQDQLYKQFDWNININDNYSSSNGNVASTQILVFRCPSDSGLEVPEDNQKEANDSSPGENSFGKKIRGVSNYVACMGTAKNRPSPSTDGSTVDISYGGMFFANSNLSIGGMGEYNSSYTILVGERRSIIIGDKTDKIPDIDRYAFWPGFAVVEAQDNNGAACPSAGYVLTEDVYGAAISNINDRGNTILDDPAFSSVHPGGAHFLLGDGTVRFLSEEIDSNPTGDNNTQGIFQTLCDRLDSQDIVF